MPHELYLEIASKVLRHLADGGWGSSFEGGDHGDEFDGEVLVVAQIIQDSIDNSD